MILSEIQVMNYRSCIDTTFAPNEHLSALIGPNGAGKTNMLFAIKLLWTLLHKTRRLYREEPPTQLSEIRSKFKIQDKTISHSAIIQLSTDRHNNDVAVYSKEKWYLWDITGSKKIMTLPMDRIYEYTRRGTGLGELDNRYDRYLRDHVGKLYDRKSVSKVVSALKEVAMFVSNMKYYGASRFTDPSSCPISFEVEIDGKNRRAPMLSEHGRFLFDMYQEYKNETSKYHEYLSLVNSDGIGLINDIKFEEIKASSQNYRVSTSG